MRGLVGFAVLIAIAGIPVVFGRRSSNSDFASGGEPQGSLRGALRALERRRRAPQGPYPLASFQDRDIIEYLGSKDGADRNDKQLLVGYLDKEDEYPSDEVGYATAFRERNDQMKNSKKSAFRERESEAEQLQELFLKNLAEQDRQRSDDEYAELLKRLWEKYKNTHRDDKKKKRSIRKRQVPGDYSPSGGWGPIAFKRKRSSNQRVDEDDNPDFLYSLKFVSQTDPAAVEDLKDDKMADEENDADVSSVLNSDVDDDVRLALQPSDEEYLPDGSEIIEDNNNAFPVSKRSPKMKRFRSAVTDPKIAKELSSIFGEGSIQKPVKRSSDDDSHEAKSPIATAQQHNETEATSTSAPETEHPHSRHEHESKPPLLATTNNGFEHSHEGPTEFDDKDETHIKLEHPIVLKKKSVDWSNYFGIDRRRKKSPMIQMHLPHYKTDKRNSEQQTNQIVVDYSPETQEERESNEKYVSERAFEYNRKKMLKALHELKQSLQAQRQEDKEKRDVKHKLDPEDVKAIDDFESEQGAGHFLNGPLESMSEGYMGGFHYYDDDKYCPMLDRIITRCQNIDLLAGDHGQLFLPLCSLHQICYLCGPSSATGCDLLFLSEADSICEGSSGCQRAARGALMALRDLHAPLAHHLQGECSRDSCVARPLRENDLWQQPFRR